MGIEKLFPPPIYPGSEWKRNLFGYFSDCHPFHKDAENKLWECSRHYRKLCDFRKCENISKCTTLMSTLPAKHGEWVSLNIPCGSSRQLNVGIRELYRGNKYKKNKNCFRKKPEIGKTRLVDPKKVLQPSEEQLFTQEFCDMLRNADYGSSVALFEKASTHLTTMWQPSGADKEIMLYAILKHATLNFIMTTHAILPAERCFHSWELKKLTNLSYKWIGDMPSKSTLDDISKFTTDFNLLFLSRSHRSMDPNTKKAIQNQNRTLVEVIERLDPEYPAKVAAFLREEGKSFDFDPDDRRPPECVPLTWDDQLSDKNEKYRMAPEGHSFEYNERISIAGKNITIPVKGRVQQGWCYSDKFPRDEIKVEPELITNVHSVKARGPHHALTRSKMRTLDYITCRDYKKPGEQVEVFHPLAPSKVDIYYKEICKELPLHINAPLALAARNQRKMKKAKVDFAPRWLDRDTSVPSFERPCSPDRFDVNRRAYLVNPHLPLAALGFTHCRHPPPPPRDPPRRVYQFNSNSSIPQNCSTGRKPKDRIRLPPIYRDALAVKQTDISNRFF